MSESNLQNVVAVLPVADHAAAVSWYQKWIGRAPDVEPIEGVAEWRIADKAWIQVAADPEPAGRTRVVIGVDDIDTQRSTCEAGGVTVGDVTDLGFIKMAEAVDPAGNTILFVQEVEQPEG
jgi:predicted enzyme related to lactoylglutathione lyase